MIAIQRSLGNLDLALEYMERGRARGVLDLLGRSRVNALAEAERRARERGDRERLAVIAKVRVELDAAERELHALTYALSQPQTDEQRAQLVARLKQARARRDGIMERRALLIRDLLPEASPASAAAIQGALKPKERILYYFVGDLATSVFLVGPTGTEIRSYDSRKARLEVIAPAIESHLAAIQRTGPGSRGVGPAPDKQTTTPTARPLADLLLPPQVREELAGLDRLYIIPDGPLHKLPFESLGVPLPPIAYCHSASVLLWCQRRRDAQRARGQRFQVVALGDPVFSRDKGAGEPPEKGVLVVRGTGPLEAGDVVVAYDRHPVADAKAMRTELRRVEDEVEEQGRREVKLKVWRAGQTIDLTVQPGSLGIEVAREPPRIAWKQLRSESLATLQRGASRFGELKRLPGTRREVESIARILGDGAVKTLLGEEATKANLFALAPMGRYLHLATHQLVDETERRGYSRLALTRPRIATPKDDGFLSLFELLDTWRDRLSACELVVLSACETLKGPMQKDEGPYAMPLGFLYAGAPAVIGSLWRVDDQSTAELFADFYKRLAKGTPKLQAFTEARKALKKKYPQPYHWAAFVYIGDPR